MADADMMAMLEGTWDGMQAFLSGKLKIKDSPWYFSLAEWIFCVAFVIELLLRLFVHRSKYFYSSENHGEETEG